MEHDFETETAERIERVIERLDSILKHQSSQNTLTVTHHSAGVTPWQAASVAACFFTMSALIIALVIIVPEIHDLRAWKDIYGRDLAAIKAIIQQPEKKP